MVTSVWNPSGFHVVNALPKWSKFKAQYYTNDMLVSVSDWRRLSWRTQQGKLWLHADNARPHTAKVSTDYITRNGMKPAHHPPYSPDLAPSDFFLFGSVKRKLIRYRPQSQSEPLVPIRIRVILAEIPRDVLNAVFLEWMDRLQKCTHTNGDYVWCAKNTSELNTFSIRYVPRCHTWCGTPYRAKN
jgi:hypothetical protein